MKNRPGNRAVSRGLRIGKQGDARNLFTSVRQLCSVEERTAARALLRPGSSLKELPTPSAAGAAEPARANVEPFCLWLAARQPGEQASNNRQGACCLAQRLVWLQSMEAPGQRAGAGQTSIPSRRSRGASPRLRPLTAPRRRRGRPGPPEL